MDQQDSKVQQSQAEGKRPQYTAPVVKTMTEAEVLSAFQVGANSGAMAWWVC